MAGMLHRFLTFASEAEIAALWGALFLVAALVAGIAEMRSTRRARIDRVGLVPWRGIFVTSAMVGTALLALAASGIAGG